MEWRLRMVGAIQWLCFRLALPFFLLLERFSPRKLMPPITEPILLQSAASLARKIRSRQLTSEAVVRAYMSRIQEVNPVINAVVEDRFETAITEAKGVDEMIRLGTMSEEEMVLEFPFLGVPMTVKGSLAVKGLHHSAGSLLRKDLVADQDSEAIRLMKKAGAIILATTNTPELCFNWETTNLVTGRTNNPYNPARNCSGSSGGEGALQGSAASVCGLGSDIAGSIRLPAMFNGIFGHKPTPEVVSIEGHCPIASDKDFAKYLTVGPMSRYSEDLPTMLKILAGKKASLLKLNEKVDLKKLKFYYMEDDGGSLFSVPVDSEILTALRKVIQHVEQSTGVKPKQLKLSEMKEALEISCSVFFGIEGLPDLLANPYNPKDRRNVFLEILKSLLNLSDISYSACMFYFLKMVNCFVPKKQYKKYADKSAMLRQKLADILGDDGVLLYPTNPHAAGYHNEVFVRTGGIMYTMIFNAIGLPATHCTMGLNREGLPIGIQVVAAPYKDHLNFAVVQDLETAFGGWVPPPSSAGEQLEVSS